MGSYYTYRFCNLLFLLHWFQLLSRNANRRAPHPQLQRSVVASLGPLLLPPDWRLVPRPGRTSPGRPTSPAPASPARAPSSRAPARPSLRAPYWTKGTVGVRSNGPRGTCPAGWWVGKAPANADVSSSRLRGTGGDAGWRGTSLTAEEWGERKGRRPSCPGLINSLSGTAPQNV